MKIRILLFLLLTIYKGVGMHKIIIWDNDGTIMGSKDPNDPSNKAKIILPNVEKIMRQKNTINIICSGTKTPESESQNYNLEKVIIKFKALMNELPIDISVFSPAIGGSECWVLIKNKNNDFSIIKIHENDQYKELIGTFKKPDVGMLVVIKDLLQERNIICDDTNTIFIGDTWQDMKAAHDVKLPFLYAEHIHCIKDKGEPWKNVLPWPHTQAFNIL